MTAIKYFFTFVLVTMFVILTVPKLSKFIFETGLIPSDVRYGDLYKLSNLPQFKGDNSPCEKEKQTENPQVSLYILGDSFLEDGRVEKSDFPIGNYRYINWSDNEKIELDTTKSNILIIETVERHAREHLSKIIDNYSKNQTVNPKEKERLIEVINPDKLNLLFLNADFFLKIKEIKAELTLLLFNRTDSKVSLSATKKTLLYGLDTDSTKPNSSFSSIEDSEIDSMISNLNKSEINFKKMGFDKIIFSIIPNKTSICCQNDGEYNHLIERVQTNKNLKVPFIDAYNLMKNKDYFQVGDTHWNCEGQAAWLRLANARIFVNEK